MLRETGLAKADPTPDGSGARGRLCRAARAGPTRAGVVSAGVDGAALQQRIEDYIASGPAPLDNVRAVLVVVDGHTQLEYYRHGFTASDHEHVWSVTKSVIATLVGIALGERLIPSLDSPLTALRPSTGR